MRARSTSEEAGPTGMAGYLASNLLPPLAGIFSRNYLIALGIGLGLMLLTI